MGIAIGHIGTKLLNDWNTAQTPEVPDRIILADASCEAIGQAEGVASMLLETVSGLDTDNGPLVKITTTEVNTHSRLMSSSASCVATQNTTIGYMNNLNFHEFPYEVGDNPVDLSDSFITAITEVELRDAIELLNSRPVELIRLGH